MYSNTVNKYLKVFSPKMKEENAKTVFATLSEAEKVERNGQVGYRYHNYYARFVGGAFEKAKELKEKDSIDIKKWSISVDYNKETGKTYVSLTVFEFDMSEAKGNNMNGLPSAPDGYGDDFMEFSDEDMPFK